MPSKADLRKDRRHELGSGTIPAVLLRLQDINAKTESSRRPVQLLGVCPGRCRAREMLDGRLRVLVPSISGADPVKQ